MNSTSHASEMWNRFSVSSKELEGTDALLYELSGVFTDSPDAYAFLGEFRERVKSGSAPVIVDLTRVDHMSSCGVGILASCFTSALNANRSLRIAGMSKRVESVMRIVGLLKVIPNYASQEEALSGGPS